MTFVRQARCLSFCRLSVRRFKLSLALRNKAHTRNQSTTRTLRGEADNNGPPATQVRFPAFPLFEALDLFPSIVDVHHFLDLKDCSFGRTIFCIDNHSVGSREPLSLEASETSDQDNKTT